MKKREKYAPLANEIIDLVGGKDNITFFTHCVTRLRFNLKDKSIVDPKQIEKFAGVVGVQWSGEQLQIIIGQDVGDVFQLINEKNNLNYVEEKTDETVTSTKKRLSFDSIIQSISGCITPLLPMLIGGGMIRVIIIICSQLGILSPDSGTYLTLTFVADASIYFLPVAIGYTGAKKFGVNPGIGILLGSVLIHPNFLSLVSEGKALSIFMIPIAAKSYTSTIFPMIITMFIAGYVERFFSKYSPKMLRSILQPLGTLLIMVPLMLTFLAPLGSYVGTYLAIGIMWVYNLVGPLGVALFAAFSPYLVVVGMHTALIPYTTQMIASQGREPIVGPAKFIRDFNQGVACIVIAIKTKNADIRSTALSCAVTAIVGGVTEPALFGLNLKVKKAMYSTIVGGFAGGLYAGFNSVARYGYGPSGILGVSVFVAPDPMNLVHSIIAIVIGVVVTFATAMIWIKEKDLHLIK